MPLIMRNLLFFSIFFNLFSLISCSPRPMPRPHAIDIDLLANISNPQVLDFIQSESRYTERMEDSVSVLQGNLLGETILQMAANSSPELKLGDYSYYFKQEQGAANPRYYRRKSLSDEELVFDPEALLSYGAYATLSVDLLRISPKHSKLAISAHLNDTNKRSLLIEDIATHNFVLIDPGDVNGFEWANDDNTFFYTTTDKQRATEVYKKSLSSSEPSRLIYKAQSADVHITLRKSKSLKYIFIDAHSANTSDVYYLHADQLGAQIRQVKSRKQGVTYEVENEGNELYVLTNENSPAFSLDSIDITSNARRKILTGPTQGTYTTLQAFKGYLVLVHELGATSEILIYNTATGALKRISFPGEIYSLELLPNFNYAGPGFQFWYRSFNQPDLLYNVDFENLRVSAQEARPKLERIKGEVLNARSEDGTQVPLWLIYSNENQNTGPRPVILYAYGAYGYRLKAKYQPELLPLLNRGVTYAVCHVRGGSYEHPLWHEAGRGLERSHSVSDLLACASTLIEKGISTADKILATGRSAGAMLIASAINSEPKLFRAVALDTPFLEVLSTMKDSNMPLIEREYIEWGDPRDSNQLKNISSYDPFLGVKAQRYPSILINAGLLDETTPASQALRYYYRVRQNQLGSNPVLISLSSSAGHNGEPNYYLELERQARINAFLLSQVGIRK